MDLCRKQDKLKTISLCIHEKAQTCPQKLLQEKVKKCCGLKFSTCRSKVSLYLLRPFSLIPHYSDPLILLHNIYSI